MGALIGFVRDVVAVLAHGVRFVLCRLLQAVLPLGLVGLWFEYGRPGSDAPEPVCWGAVLVLIACWVVWVGRVQHWFFPEPDATPPWETRP